MLCIDYVSIMLYIVLPILLSLFIMLLFDIYYNCIYYDYLYGSDVLYVEHLFWLFAHPEVYIIIFLVFGLLVIMLLIINLSIYGLLNIFNGLFIIMYLSFIVWSHHLYVVNLFVDILIYYIIVTLLISIPSGNKLYNYIFNINFISLLINYNSFNCIYYLLIIYKVIYFIILLLIGGISGYLFINLIIIYIYHDIYYIINHFHFIFSLSILFIIILSIYCISYFNIIFNCIFIYISVSVLFNILFNCCNIYYKLFVINYIVFIYLIMFNNYIFI